MQGARCKVQGARVMIMSNDINKKRTYIFILSFVVLVSFYCSISWSQEFTVDTKESRQHQQIYAVLTPVHEAELSSELNAKVKQIYFKPGDKFKKNDLLISFDCAPIELELKGVEAELKGTKAKLESNQQLDKLNSVSKLDLSLSESEHQKMLAKKSTLIYQKEKCLIKAPFNGEVINKEVNENEAVKSGDNLISIVSNQDVEVKMFVPSKWLEHIKIGSSFMLFLNEVHMNDGIPGKITKIVGRIDPASQSLLIFGKLSPRTVEKQQFYVGMSGHAQFDLKKENNKVNFNE